MDQGLFTKHIRNIQERNTIKQKIIETILKKTGIVVEESEITLTKKNIQLSMSSVKKTAFLQKKGKEILTELGYTLRV